MSIDHPSIDSSDAGAPNATLERRGALAVAASAILAPLSASAQQPQPASAPVSRRRCLVSTYSGFTGTISLKQFDAALSAGVAALAATKSSSLSGAEQDQLVQHILALRHLQAGLEE